MTASFPNQLKNTFGARRQDLIDVVEADDVNAIYDEVVAIEATLGRNPHTSTLFPTATTVVDRLGFSDDLLNTIKGWFNGNGTVTESQVTGLTTDLASINAALATKAATSYVDSHDGATLSSAQSYTDSQIATESAARSAADSSEASTRAAADTTLTNNLNTEISNRTSGDTNLQTQINNMVVARGHIGTATDSASSGMTSATSGQTWFSGTFSVVLGRQYLLIASAESIGWSGSGSSGEGEALAFIEIVQTAGTAVTAFTSPFKWLSLTRNGNNTVAPVFFLFHANATGNVTFAFQYAKGNAGSTTVQMLAQAGRPGSMSVFDMAG